MEQIISATHARIHFGEVMRQAQQSPVVVERDGVPQVVVISKQYYDELQRGASLRPWRELLQDAHQRIRQESSGRNLPPPEETLRQLREERDEEYPPVR